MSGLQICNCLEHEAGPLICFSWRKISNLSYCLLIEGQTCISLYTSIAQNWAVLAYIWVSNVGIVNVIFLFNHKYFAMEVIFGCWLLGACELLRFINIPWKYTQFLFENMTSVEGMNEVQSPSFFPPPLHKLGVACIF